MDKLEIERYGQSCHRFAGDLLDIATWDECVYIHIYVWQVKLTNKGDGCQNHRHLQITGVGCRWLHSKKEPVLMQSCLRFTRHNSPLPGGWQQHSCINDMRSLHFVCIRLVDDGRNLTILATMTQLLISKSNKSNDNNQHRTNTSNQYIFLLQSKQKDDKASDSFIAYYLSDIYGNLRWMHCCWCSMVGWVTMSNRSFAASETLWLSSLLG